MRNFIFIILLCLFWCGIDAAPYETLRPFKIRLWTGDETVTLHEINIYDKGGKFYADRTLPYYYYGNKFDSVWTTELDDNKAKLCLGFLNKAKELSKKCRHLLSSSRQDFCIYVDSTSFRVGPCIWDCCDFYALQDSLFGQQFKDLDQKRKNLSTDIANALDGSWIPHFTSANPKMNDTVVLTRTTDNNACHWNFGSNFPFESHCNTPLDLHASESYRIITTNPGYANIVIASGDKTEKDGSTSLANYGVWFDLISLSHDRIVLKYLWR